MLQAYIDSSHNDDIEVVAGFVATEQAWSGFDDSWQAVLTQYGLHHFHTTDYWSRRRPYDRIDDAQHLALRSELCATLKTTKSIAFGSIVSKAAYKTWSLSQSSFEHSDAHYFGLDRCLRFLIHGINIHPIDDGVQIVCDDDKEHRKLTEEMQQWHEARLRRIKRRLPGHPDPQRPIHFSFDQPHKNPRLQAADVISNASFRWGVSDLSGQFEEPQFIAGIKPECPIAVMPFMSAEVIAIDVKARNRPQDEL